MEERDDLEFLDVIIIIVGFAVIFLRFRCARASIFGARYLNSPADALRSLPEIPINLFLLMGFSVTTAAARAARFKRIHSPVLLNHFAFAATYS